MQQGFILALITALLWGITPILDKLSVAHASPTAVIAVRFTTAFLCILPLYMMPAVRQEILQLDRRTLLYITSATVLSAIFGIGLYFLAMQRMEATRVTTICASYPLVTFALGWILLQEQVTFTKALGTILTVAGVILVSL